MHCTPRLHRRHLIHALALAALAASGSVMAQAWPSKPITLIVPFPAGGTTDVLARALGEKLTLSLGQTVIVESKPGAGATLGADYVTKAKPDGYTLLVGAVHHTIASSVYKKLPYDFQKDLAPITTIAMVPNVLVVNPGTPAKNVAELVALLKAKPGDYTYGSNGNGTAQHLIGTQFENLTGTDLIHIPYKGSGPLATDLLGGQVTMSFDDRDAGAAAHQGGQAATARRHHREALVRLAGCSDPRRSRAEGLQHRHLVRRPRAGRHAEGHRGASQHRDGEGHPVARIPQAHGGDRCRADRRQHRTHDPADQGRDREVREAGQGREGHDRVAPELVPIRVGWR